MTNSAASGTSANSGTAGTAAGSATAGTAAGSATAGTAAGPAASGTSANSGASSAAASAPTIRRLGQPGDLGWVVMANGEVYAREFGWTTEFDALAARIVADYATAHDPVREAAWIAELAGERVGCILLVADPDDPETAKLRVLVVDPRARGHGLGGRLVDTCLQFARSAGYARVRLWTVNALVAARAIYLSRGFRLTAEEPRHSFGADLISQTYELELSPGAGGRVDPSQRRSTVIASP